MTNEKNNVPTFAFESVTVKADGKGKGQGFLQCGEFKITSRNAGAILAHFNSGLSMLNSVLDTDYTGPMDFPNYGKLCEMMTKDPIAKLGGKEILSFVATSGYEQKDEALRYFLQALFEEVSSEDSVQGFSLIASNNTVEELELMLNHPDAHEVLCDMACNLLRANIMENTSYVDNFKSKVAAIKADPKRGIKDGKLVLKAKKESKKKATA